MELGADRHRRQAEQPRTVERLAQRLADLAEASDLGKNLPIGQDNFQLACDALWMRDVSCTIRFKHDASFVRRNSMAFAAMKAAADAMDDENASVSWNPSRVRANLCFDPVAMPLDLPSRSPPISQQQEVEGAAPPTVTLRHPICRHPVSRMSRMQAMPTKAVATRTLKAVP
jgi:hypothetical protein